MSTTGTEQDLPFAPSEPRSNPGEDVHPRKTKSQAASQLALHDPESTTRGWFEAAAGLALCDPNGRFSGINQAFSSLTGYTEAELVGQRWSLLAPAGSASDSQLVERLLRVDPPRRSLEVSIIRKSGERAWLALSASLQRDALGAPVALVLIAQDITDQHRREDELRKSNALLEAAVRRSNICVWEFDLPDGRLENASATLINVWEQAGLNPQGMPTKFVEAFGIITHEDDRPRVWQTIHEALRDGCDAVEWEVRIRNKDGGHHWVLARGGIQRNDQGMPVRITGSSVDIDDLKRADRALRDDLSVRWQLEAALRRAKERLDIAVQGSNLTVWEFDMPDGNMATATPTYVNVMEYAGLDPSAVPRAFADAFPMFVHPEDLEPVGKKLYEALEGGGHEFESELRVLHKDGTYHSSLARAGIQRDEHGMAIRVTGSTVDIDQLKRVEQDLRHAKDAAEAANRAKDEFLANVSHEIRTPMNAILGMTELVLDTPLTPDQRLSLNTVKSATDNLLGLINDLLDFSKIEAGGFALEAGEFSLRAVLTDTLRALASRAHRKGLELVSQVRPDVPDALVGDAGRLRQVVLNLVGNAIKFTERGEVVVLVAASERSSSEASVVLTFAIHDTGIGIPPDKQQSIFRAFEQEDSSTTRKYGGTGLGLTISAQIAKLMNGGISVESVPGRGSVFTFTAEFGFRASTTEASHANPHDCLAGLRGLIVDDNATNRQILEEWLKNWQIEPTAVADGTAALDELWDAATSGRPYSFMLLDTRMPDTDGLAVAQLIRKRPELAFVRLILLTSSDRPGDSARYRELEVEASLLKPVQPAELFDTIHRIMGFPDRQPVPEPSRLLPVRAAPRRILVAEDNEFNAQFLETVLTRRGHRVQLASNGREALAFEAAERFDMLLLDIHMPEKDGFEVIRAIREREQGTNRRLQVLALTARSRPQDREQCLAAGMDGFLAKPVRIADLWSAIAALDQSSPVLNGAAAATEPRPSSLLSPDVLLAACGADPVILSAMCRSLAIHLPSSWSKLSAALQAGDSAQLSETTHQLRGMLAAFSTLVSDALAQVEDLADSGRLDECAARLPGIGELAQQLLAQLSPVTVQSLKAQAASN